MNPNTRSCDSVLWHLYDEGTATAQALATLTGWDTARVSQTLRRLINKTLVGRTDRKNPATYRLTPAGKEAAARITRDQVDFAPAPCAPVSDVLVSGGELGRKPEAPATPPAALGWQIGQPAELDRATIDAVASRDTAINVLEADDMVCAINSRGDFVIDLGDGDLVKFPPAQALYLKRFLDNTSMLEELAAQGQI